MREIVRFAKTEALPRVGDVLQAQALPAEDALAPRLRRLLDDAFASYLLLVEPRAVCEDVTLQGFAALLAPLELSADELAVGRVYPRAQALALYVATLGEALPARIRKLFDEDELAEGYMLDAVASAGADLLGDRLAERFAAAVVARGVPGSRTLPYSPGYCGWPTTGQRQLFAALRPEEIGVTLNDSCLMSPIKSVSGVLVAGPAEAHRFRPDLESCHHCRSRDCGPRLAGLLGRGKAS